MRLPKSRRITGIHAVTSTNGLHHCYLAASDPRTRHLILLQAVGWLSQFRTQATAAVKDLPRKFDITELEPAAAVSNPLAAAAADPNSAAAQVMRLAGNMEARQSFQSEAVRLTLGKADEVHYYKYLASLIEDVPLVSPDWQAHLLAATVFYTKGPDDPEPAPMRQARELLRAGGGVPRDFSSPSPSTA